jgi:hypothetical protein
MQRRWSLFRFGAGILVAAWTLLCVLAYVLVEVLGETFVGQASLVLGSTLGSLLVLVWVAVAWVIWTVGRALGGQNRRRG